MKLESNSEYTNMVHAILDVLQKYNVSSMNAVIEGDDEHGHLALAIKTTVYPTVAEAQAAVESLSDDDDDEVPSNVTIQ